MADHDEFDALLEEPFGEDVDWNAVDGMAGDNRVAAAADARSTSESDEYFNDGEVFDESFLNEVRRLETRAAGHTSVVNALPHGMILPLIVHARASLDDRKKRCNSSCGYANVAL
jgi:hypothetical protein